MISAGLGESPELAEDVLDILGERGFESHQCPSAGVPEAQNGGMKGRSGQSLENSESRLPSLGCCSGSAVVPVPDHRESRLGEMDADLMGPSCFDANREECRAGESFNHRGFAEGLLRPATAARYLLAVVTIAADGFFEQEPGRCLPVYESQVVLLHGAAGELTGERVMGLIVLGDHEKPRSASVEAVDDPRARDATDAAQVRAVMEQGMDQRSPGVTWCGVYDHVSRFDDDEQILVLVDDIDRNRLRLGLGRFGRRHLDEHSLSGVQQS
jgi:hypothetical protein